MALRLRTVSDFRSEGIPMMQFELRRGGLKAVWCAFCAVGIMVSPQWILAQAPTAAQPAVMGQQTLEQLGGKDKQSSDAQTGLGQKTPPSTTKDQKTGQDQTSATKPAGAAGEAASTSKLKLGPLDPAPPPTGLPTIRRVIGLALGGGAALAISEIGMLQWLDEHHVPVDVIAGTSMGSILAALYSTGVTPEQMKHILNPTEVGRVFRIASAYSSRSFRRREDARDVPNGIALGLKHGASVRNSLLTDTGLNELLDKEFIRYNDQIDF